MPRNSERMPPSFVAMAIMSSMILNSPPTNEVVFALFDAVIGWTFLVLVEDDDGGAS